MDLPGILAAVRDGELTAQDAERRIRNPSTLRVGAAWLELDRVERCRFPEVVFAPGKSDEQLSAIAIALREANSPLIVSRLATGRETNLLRVCEHATYDPDAQLLFDGTDDLFEPSEKKVAVISAGLSDGAVAAECARILKICGYHVHRFSDVGVAGLQRLLVVTDLIRESDAIVVIAGMDGALPSVVAGLFGQPVIAVPTSVGYGASFDGLSALLAMLNSCAPGLSVVNIDNGLGAAVAIHRILFQPEGRRD